MLRRIGERQAIVRAGHRVLHFGIDIGIAKREVEVRGRANDRFKLDALRNRREQAYNAGSPRSVERQHETGKLLAWNNLRADGSPNPTTIHQGMKVRAGTKYVITKWYRERAWA